MKCNKCGRIFNCHSVEGAGHCTGMAGCTCNLCYKGTAVKCVCTPVGVEDKKVIGGYRVVQKR